MTSAECRVQSAESRVGFFLIPHPSSLIPAAAAALALAVGVAGCGTTAPTKAPPRPGGYYLDDGPGANPPANLDAIPDAVPRAEPLNRGTMRPYAVMGRQYSPMTELAPYKARGIASWYGRRYHGKLTASGEPYDMYAMTAAHTTLPIPSYARVTNLKTGRSVVVRVNDRGPFVEGRIIDLSYSAAHRIGVLAGGNALVEVETLIPDGFGATIAAAPRRAPGTAPALATAVPESGPAAAPLPAEPSRSPAPAAPITADAAGYYVQLGAFGSRQNAESFLVRMKAEVEWLASILHIFAREGLYRVHAGPYAGEAEARRDASRIGETLGIRPFVLTR